jgi:hypothetical protein
MLFVLVEYHSSSQIEDQPNNSLRINAHRRGIPYNDQIIDYML